MSRLFAAVLVANGLLLVPDNSYAGIIIPFDSRANADVLAHELSSSAEPERGKGGASRNGSPVLPPQKKAPGDDVHRAPRDADLWAAMDSPGGATNTPSHGERSVESLGVFGGGSALAPSRVSGRVSLDETMMPPSCVRDGLLDPPKLFCLKKRRCLGVT